MFFFTILPFIFSKTKYKKDLLNILFFYFFNNIFVIYFPLIIILIL